MTESEALRYQEDFFSQNPAIKGLVEMMERIPELTVYVKNTESRYVYNNETHRVIYDRQPWHQLIGKRASDFFPPLLGEAYEKNDRKIFETAQPLKNEIWLVPTIRGTPRWFVSNKTPLFASDGRLIGLAGTLFPISTPRDQMTHFGELRRVIAYIERHYVDELSAEGLAREAGLSVPQFNRRFRQLLRLSPMEYVFSLRIQRAQLLLATTRRTIGDIAASTGFYDQSHFTKRFRQATGLTPLQYRRDFQK